MQIFLKSIYYALFELHINYTCIIWGQNISITNRLYILQKRALRIINFKEHNAHSSPLFHYSKIIKIADKVKIENCLFINKYTNNKLPSIFTNWFPFSSLFHNYQALFAYKRKSSNSWCPNNIIWKKMLLFIRL